ncbi:MAG: aldose epimerase family protein [Pseudomonadota bacterium]
MIEPFGSTQDSAEVRVVKISAGGLTAHVLTLGGILQDLKVDGAPMTPGGASLAAYDHGPLRFFGALIGPVAGRIADARGPFEGGTLDLSATGAPHALHSGTAGLHATIWEIADHGPSHVALQTRAEPGAGGLPGARRFTATYSAEPDALRLGLEAETDAPTWVNLTQHSYWHLGGRPTIDGHRFHVLADRFLPITDAVLPTGHIAPLADSPVDFHTPRAIGPTDRLDHCFCISSAEGPLRPVAHLTGPTGHRLTLETTAPGLQVHTGDGVSAPPGTGHAGAAIHSRTGLALEAQSWPDAPNNPGFPSIRLDPGTKWRREILWRFDRVG